MPRNVCLIAMCALALLICSPGGAQDTPSLGDLARQAQKNKGAAPAAKKVFTNDDVASGSTPGLAGLVGQPASSSAPAGQPAPPGKEAAPSTPAQDLARMEAMLTMIDSLDRATLAKNVLQELDVNFPGRANWEEKLFTAKQVYVSQGRNLLYKAKQLDAEAQSLQGNQNANDPRVKDVVAHLKQIIEEASRTGATFQAIMLEGRDLATQAQGH